ncbi:MAG: hypothetical protein PHX60_10860 [Giesbergeria sp.]|uniref:class I SAM-dependent DNA methyltransferase n=1 Tax=Giesbergeria sp. TaxID=2818473 RepID=UPI0026301DCB|nr:DNA methyltransferase [Giesbergeria sp.]MDD2610168.1 hypothetical protein [Giesbergeria sp.]
MTPQDFITKWGAPGGVPGPAYGLNEEQGAQSHFLDLCELLDVPKPGSAAGYLFEEKSYIIGGKTGYADVSLRGVFAWENKAPGKNLDAALKQLLSYSLALANPPLLVVSDRLTIRIHTQFTGHPSQTHTIEIEELDQPEKRALLRRIWTAPESFKPRQTNRDITEAAARSFATLAEGLRQRGAGDANAVAHFLTQCLFCFFAEDVGLLPDRMFERLVNNQKIAPERLGQGLEQLFGAMQNGGLFGVADIPWFNGGLFQTIHVPALTAPDVLELRRAAQLNWSAIDVSIFGTLFERGLDPAKRSQLGAHYTDPATIERIIDPVIRRPLLRQWQVVAQEIKTLMAPFKKKGDKHYRAAQARFVQWLDMLKNYRALDPACGSGNFLFLALKCLKDVEHHSHLEATTLGLEREADLVTGPHNVLGIELNEYAAELARVTVWIGELQWRLAHGYEFKMNPVLEALEHIECRDALLHFGTNTVTEAAWPLADVVIGNPPFLGGSKKRGELGGAYFEALKTVYDKRVPSGADLVCYWFDKARAQIEAGQLKRAGLVTTNSIRGGANRKVLEAICTNSRIFEAWSDEPWINNGAAVRVSLVCFGDELGATLNGTEVHSIHPDLTGNSAESSEIASTNLTTAVILPEAAGTCFMGASKKAPFDIDGDTARSWLALPNPHQQSNAEVVRPLCNGIDLNRRWGDRWIVDFGTKMSEADASLFEAPFSYVSKEVKPLRETNNRESYRKFWWRHAEARPGMRVALANLPRFIITAAVAKYRIFVWMHSAVLADQATLAIARADDTTLGILHSRFHELWSLRMCTFLGVGNDPRYTPTTCFETFPFPPGLTPQDTAHQRTEALADGAYIPADLTAPAVRAAASAIAQAAQRLDTLRQGWLHPPQWTQRLPEVVPLGLAQSPYPERILPLPGFEKELAQRTLTKLYNQRPAWLAAAHAQLDAAVAAAYGWTDYTPEMPDEEILRRLLALNLARSQAASD